MVGYVWADVARANAAAVITGTDASAVKSEAEKLAQSYFEARDQFEFGPTTGSLSEMMQLATNSDTQPVVLTDSGDNPGGGRRRRPCLCSEILR